jgi:predicted enzyme related to lactoylglutathione lyase
MNVRSLAVIGLLFWAGFAAAAAIDLPPLTDSTAPEHHVGKVIWADLVTPDLAAAERFYGGLFGWTFHETRHGSSNYAVALNDDRPIAGLVQKAPPPGESKHPAWLTFIAVEDVDVAKTLALRNGATVLSEPVTYARRGRQAVLRDPQGAAFALLASTSGDPPDLQAEPGDWIWSTLLTHDVDQAAAFYQTLFGYEVYDMTSVDGMEHVVLSREDYARAGARDLPAQAAHAHPHWLNFVRVDDAIAAAGKVEGLGGKVLVAPHLDRHGGHVAVFADPAGAPFGVMEWTDADSPYEPKSAAVTP